MTRVLTFLLIISSATLPAWSAEKSRAKNVFERELFSPAVVSPLGIDEQRFKALDQQHRRNLLSARSVLVTFLKVSQSHSPDLRGIVDSELLGRFPDQSTLLDKLFEPETEVVLASITSFVIKPTNEIELDYYIVLFAEGKFILHEDKALLRPSGGKWLIVHIGGLQ